jgi:hypothetical protein
VLKLNDEYDRALFGESHLQKLQVAFLFCLSQLKKGANDVKSS